MEENSIFRIPTSSSVSDLEKAKINAVEVSSAPINIQTQASSPVKMADLYQELTAISEEVISCRNAILGRA